MDIVSFSSQWVDIANRALLRIGQRAVQSLDDGSTSANYCMQLLPNAVDAVLSVYPWRDCLKRSQLAPIASSPAYGFKHQFVLPKDFARLKSVSTSFDDGQADSTWSLEGSYILSDSDTINILYSALPTTPEALSASTRDLIVRQLAYLISIPLIKNEGMTSRLLSEYQSALSIAINQDNVVHYEEDTSVGWLDLER